LLNDIGVSVACEVERKLISICLVTSERKKEEEGNVCHLPIMAINMFNKRIGTKIMNVMKTVLARLGYEISFS
jgi:enhancing lycopene biosynthesis protein 2